MISVLAFITTLPGQRDAVLADFLANVPFVRAEPGCIEYAVHVDPAIVEQSPAPLGGDAFVVIEKWDDYACLEAHRVAPHMKAYAAKTRDKLASRVVHVLSAVPGQ